MGEPTTGIEREIRSYYDGHDEDGRLFAGRGRLELARTRELLARHLPPPPAKLLDVGGGSGVYAAALAAEGYDVHLVDPVPKHIEQAAARSARRPERPLASVAVGDARKLPFDDGTFDATLLLGPLYHLTSGPDRIRALAEARRVLRPGGVVCAAVISRFASTLDGFVHGFMDDPVFEALSARDLRDGQHRNPTGEAGYFTTAFFHHPGEVRGEIESAGLVHETLLPIEGPMWLLQDFDEHWDDPERRERLLESVRALEGEPSLLGASAHLLAIARRAA